MPDIATPETTSLWTITDEVTLSNAIKVEKVKHADDIPKAQFRDLDEAIHSALTNQDSDKALILITR
jgi:hypothetical protein